MLFSEPEGIEYERAPLHEVICQLRFPTILSIENKEPADFQEAIRGEFPRYMARKEALPVRQGTNPQAPRETVTNYHFVSEDGLWKMNLTKEFFALSTLHYTTWREFAARLDMALAKFIEIYQPAFFERIGLRYVNIISRKHLDLEGTPWSELIAPAYLGPLAEADVAERCVGRCAVDFEMMLDSSSHAKIHAGQSVVKSSAPNAPQDDELKFILDIDLFMLGKNMPVNFCGGSLETLHTHSGKIFCGAITDKLREAIQ